MAGSQAHNLQKTIHTSRSFSRMDAASASSPRKRASTLQERGITAVPYSKEWEAAQHVHGKAQGTDVFESQDDDEDGKTGDDVEAPTPELRVPSTFDELPIEIKSLTDRFLESLSAKVHPQPLSADNLSELFQDFYERAAAQIATHIATLSSHLAQKSSPGQPKVRSREGSTVRRENTFSTNSGGEMLTPTELSDRKRARRLLELKRVALEEAVERAVVEKVYDRLWQHRSTDDEARDEKLNSRAAALSLVGIGLRELHMDSESTPDSIRNTKEEKEEEIYQSLAPAREALQKMDDEHYPLGKLRHLTEAHKSIVEVLSELFPSSSSADEILPTLIYTLINAPSGGINAVSNLNFIQRFRASSKVDGEAAYCLVNLEAAISFLETVDLSSLRSDEPPEGPPKSTSQPSTPAVEREVPDRSRLTPAQASTATPTAQSQDINASSKPTNNVSDSAKAALNPGQDAKSSRPNMAQRRLSSLVQAQADKIEASRHNFLSATDKIYESINGSLENSLQFVFGRFKDNNSQGSPLPKTLEDARKLVSSPTTGDDEEILNNSGGSSPAFEDPLGNKFDSRLADLIGGRKQLRDRSVDSTRSVGSNKRVAFNETTMKDKVATKDDHPASAAVAAGSNIFATINPLNRLNVASFTRFARTSTPIASPSPSSEKENRLAEITESPGAPEESRATAQSNARSNDKSDLSASQDLNMRETLAELRKTKPPKRRFLDVQSAAELKIGEVEELLMDYRRLAKAIGEAIAM